jgi:hypothetical protein
MSPALRCSRQRTVDEDQDESVFAGGQCYSLDSLEIITPLTYHSPKERWWTDINPRRGAREGKSAWEHTRRAGPTGAPMFSLNFSSGTGHDFQHTHTSYYYHPTNEKYERAC